MKETLIGAVIFFVLVLGAYAMIPRGFSAFLGLIMVICFVVWLYKK